MTGKPSERLSKAKKVGGSYSDVINRLSETKLTALKQRGEREIIASDGRTLLVRIDQANASGRKVVSQLHLRFFSGFKTVGTVPEGKPLGVKDVGEKTVDSETIIVAAKYVPIERSM